MRRTFFKLFILALSVFFISSCDKEDTTDNQLTAEDVSKVRTIMTAGQWKITYYFDDKDETSDYTSFVFTFNADGVLSVTNGSIAATGSWSIEEDFGDSSDDSSSDDGIDFNIFFSNPDIFEELTDDWDIVSYSENKIELKDVSGGDGTTDFLTIEKM